MRPLSKKYLIPLLLIPIISILISYLSRESKILLWTINILFIIFFIFSFKFIFKKNFLFSIFYLFLFIYTINTQVVYLLYPEQLVAIAGNQYYGLATYFSHIVFVFLSFIGIFITFIFLEKHWTKKPFLKIKNLNKYKTEKFFLSLIGVHIIITIILLFLNYSNLNYFTAPIILKSNKLFLYSYMLYGSTLLILFSKIISPIQKRLKSSLYLFLFTLSLLIFAIISIKAGQRIELAGFILAFASLLFLRFGKQKKHSKKIIALILLFLFLSISFLLVIRAMRTSELDVGEFIETSFNNPSLIIANMKIQGLIIQDYTIPSLSLMTAINFNLISPIETTKALILNSIVLTNYPSLGPEISLFINPNLQTGESYGFYFLTEGFLMAGWFGILYNALIFCLGIFAWAYLTKSDNREFNIFTISILILNVFNIVRNQSSSFIKMFYLIIVPSIILYLLSTNQTITRK